LPLDHNAPHDMIIIEVNFVAIPCRANIKESDTEWTTSCDFLIIRPVDSWLFAMLSHEPHAFAYINFISDVVSHFFSVNQLASKNHKQDYFHNSRVLDVKYIIIQLLRQCDIW
jgi:hypothetical protein